MIKSSDPGGLVMSLNGENLELDTIDIYTLTEDAVAYEFVAGRSVFPTPSSEVLRLPKRSRKGVKIDTTSPVFAFYNDVEKDARYATWSKDVRKLLAADASGFPRDKICTISSSSWTRREGRRGISSRCWIISPTMVFLCASRKSSSRTWPKRTRSDPAVRKSARRSPRRRGRPTTC